MKTFIFTFLLTAIFLFAGCGTKKDKVISEQDKKTMEDYYKQWDSTMTYEKADSFKKKEDSLHQWRDTKLKKR